MKKVSIFHIFHNWNGCTCRVCGKTRDEGHDWNGCKCLICGKVRGTGHDWDGKTCLSKCRICGNKRGIWFINEGHDWNGCKCRICGQVRDAWHNWEFLDENVWEEILGQSVDDYSIGKAIHRSVRYRCRICGKEKEETETDWEC